MKSFLRGVLSPINRLKIVSKLMVMYIIGGLIPLLMVSIYLSTNTRSILIERALEEATTNTTRVEERLSEVFKIVSDISDGLYVDEELHNIVRTYYRSDLQVIKDLNNYTKMDDYLRLYSEIEGIRIYVSNDTLLDDSQILKAKPIHKQSDWYRQALAMDGRRTFLYRYDDISRAYYLSMLRLIKTDQGENLGVLVINISNRYLGRMVDSEPYEMTLILDGETMILSRDAYLEGKKVEDSQDMIKINQLEEGIWDYENPKGEYKVLVDKFKLNALGNEFKLLTLMPLEKLVESANDSVRTSVLIILVSVCISVLLVYLLSKALGDRINHFRVDMHKVAMGDFNVLSDVDGDDEFTDLSKDLNMMILSIQQLIHEVYEVRLQKEQLGNKQREAEFKMLASQINPHFLYNALETIRMKAHLNGQKEIAEVVKKLAKIMRRNLSISNDEVTLEAELELVRHYLEIQQFRFGDKVGFRFEILCNISDYMVLPLLLQPLVENAFVHGLEGKVGKGEIVISLSDNGKFLRVDVTDDGNGIKESQLAYLKGLLASDVLSIDGSIGLTNVNQRIKIYYGERYHLDISSVFGEGTKVSLFLPSAIGGKMHVQSSAD